MLYFPIYFTKGMVIDNQTFPFNFLESAIAVDHDLILSVMVRTILVTIFVLLVIRWIGHKGLGQLNMYELLILIGLGSAIGDPMIYEEMSFPQAFTAILIVIGLFKLFDYLTMKSKIFSKITVANPILIVQNGHFVNGGLTKARLNEQEYYSYMRIHGIKDISEVEISYLESNGQVSFIKK